MGLEQAKRGRRRRGAEEVPGVRGCGCVWGGGGGGLRPRMVRLHCPHEAWAAPAPRPQCLLSIMSVFGASAVRFVSSSSSLHTASASPTGVLGSTGLCMHPGQGSLPSYAAVAAGPMRGAARGWDFFPTVLRGGTCAAPRNMLEQTMGKWSILGTPKNSATWGRAC